MGATMASSTGEISGEDGLTFDEIDGLADGERHLALDGELPGDELADHHDDKPCVDHPDAGALPGELEANGVGGEEVDEQEHAERVAGGKGKSPGTFTVAGRPKKTWANFTSNWKGIQTPQPRKYWVTTV